MKFSKKLVSYLVASAVLVGADKIGVTATTISLIKELTCYYLITQGAVDGALVWKGKKGA